MIVFLFYRQTPRYIQCEEFDMAGGGPKNWLGVKVNGYTFIRATGGKCGPKQNNIEWEVRCDDCGALYYVIPGTIARYKRSNCACQKAKRLAMGMCSRCKKVGQEMKTKKTCILCAQKAKDSYLLSREEVIARTGAWSKENPEKMREYRKKWVKEHRTQNKDVQDAWRASPGGRFSTAQSYAKQRKLEFALSKEQYADFIALPCYFCRGFLGKSSHGIALDRMDNSLGYLPTNVISCCGWCNRIKSDWMTVEEALAAVAAVLLVRGIVLPLRQFVDSVEEVCQRLQLCDLLLEQDGSPRNGTDSNVPQLTMHVDGLAGTPTVLDDIIL
jgi:hypothetical protein